MAGEREKGPPPFPTLGGQPGPATLLQARGRGAPGAPSRVLQAGLLRSPRGCPGVLPSRLPQSKDEGESKRSGHTEHTERAAPRGRLQGRAELSRALGSAAGPRQTRRFSALAQLVVPDAQEKVLKEAAALEPAGEALLLLPPEHGGCFSPPRVAERSSRTSSWQGAGTRGRSKRPARVLCGGRHARWVVLGILTCPVSHKGPGAPAHVGVSLPGCGGTDARCAPGRGTQELGREPAARLAWSSSVRWA